MPRNRLPLVACAILSVVGFTTVSNSASADIIAQEAFAYDAGSLATNNGGSGFASGWTGAGNVTAGSLDSPVTTGETGNKATVTGGASSATAFRILDANVNTGTVYVGFIFTRKTTGTRTTGLSLFDGSNERLLIGVSGNEGNGDLFISGSNSSSGDTNINATPGTAFQLVAKIVFNASGDETVSLFVNQATEGIADATNIASFDGSGFDRIRLFGGSTRSAPEGTGSGDFDEIRIADNYAQALIPEPASLALLGLGGLLMLPHRRHGCSRI